MISDDQARACYKKRTVTGPSPKRHYSATLNSDEYDEGNYDDATVTRDIQTEGRGTLLLGASPSGGWEAR
jgi:hypothetical protein